MEETNEEGEDEGIVSAFLRCLGARPLLDPIGGDDSCSGYM